MNQAKFRFRLLPLILVVVLGFGLPILGAIIANALSRVLPVLAASLADVARPRGHFRDQAIYALRCRAALAARSDLSRPCRPVGCLLRHSDDGGGLCARSYCAASDGPRIPSDSAERCRLARL